MTETDLACLRTERCILRPWRLEDAPLLPLIADTRDISWNTSYRFPHPFDLEAAKRYIEFHIAGSPPDEWSYAITLEEALIGGCRVWRGIGVHAHTAEIGYWLGVDYWGYGLATEIVLAVIGHVAATSDIEQITANCFGWNTASQRVLEKCGFSKAGIIRNAVKKWGATTDLHVYDRLIR